MSDERGRKPRVGDVVWFVPPTQAEPQPQAAIVTFVGDRKKIARKAGREVAAPVSLCTLCPEVGDTYMDGVGHAAEPTQGCWSWPGEREA